MKQRVAILIDGSFFIKRFPKIFHKKVDDPQEFADRIHTYALKHLQIKKNNNRKIEGNSGKEQKEVPLQELYRIFFMTVTLLKRSFTTRLVGSL